MPDAGAIFPNPQRISEAKQARSRKLSEQRKYREYASSPIFSNKFASPERQAKRDDFIVKKQK